MRNLQKEMVVVFHQNHFHVKCCQDETKPHSQKVVRSHVGQASNSKLKLHKVYTLVKSYS